MKKIGSKAKPARPVTPPNKEALDSSIESTRQAAEDLKEKFKELTYVNKELQEYQRVQEQESLEIIKSIQTESDIKERKVIVLEKHLDRLKHDVDKEKLITSKSNDDKIANLLSIIHDKEIAFAALQSEIGQMKDFKKKKFELMQEVERQKQELVDTEQRHQELMANLERKFIKEKIRLQLSADTKIETLAAQAHGTALKNIKEATKDVYKENIQMVEALRYHINESEMLSKHNFDLLEQNQHLKDEKEVSDMLVRDKVVACKALSQQILLLNLKIEDVEQCLSLNLKKHSEEKGVLVELATTSVDQIKRYADRLREEIGKKTREMRHVKRLAQHVLNQRTDVERFFIESLDHVKSAIDAQHELQRSECYNDYNRKLKNILDTKGLSHTIFSDNFKPLESHNRRETVFKKSQLSSVNIEELSWADKERVLRLLFAKMNGLNGTSESREKDQLKPTRVLPLLSPPILSE